MIGNLASRWSQAQGGGTSGLAECCASLRILPCIPAAFLQSHAKGSHMQPRMLTACQILHRFSWLVSGNGWQCSAFTCIPSCVSTMYPAEGLKSLQKIPACIQIFCALSPPDPDYLHWPLICQELLMDTWTWYKASFGHLHLRESKQF